MKKMLSLIVVAFLVGSLATKTFAHSHLADSNPHDGEVMTEAVQEIVINFDGKIMQGSFIEVTSTEGASYEVDTIDIGEGQMKATLAEPLPNGEYKVDWSIISADGHPVEGKYTFTVNVPESNVTPNEDSQEGQTEEQGTTTETPEKNVEPSEEDTNMLMYVVVGLAVIILAVGGLLLFRRKK